VHLKLVLQLAGGLGEGFVALLVVGELRLDRLVELFEVSARDDGLRLFLFWSRERLLALALGELGNLGGALGRNLAIADPRRARRRAPPWRL
jgi:hypothetical protein